MNSIAVFGSLNIDLVSQMERFPEPGETLIAHSFATFPGGKGANQAVACGRLGAQVTMFGALGGDEFAVDLVRSLHASHVQTEHVLYCDNVPTGVASIWVNAQGKNSIAVTAGANGRVDRHYLHTVLPELKHTAWLLLQLEIPLETIDDLLKQLPSRRPRVILDPAPAQSLNPLMTSRLAVITPNETELEALTKLPVSSEQEIQKACRFLLNQTGAQAVVCKAGDSGAYLDDGRHFRHFPGYTVRSVDSTAAGDTFNGALATSLAAGDTFERAIRFANASGALCVKKTGGATLDPLATGCGSLHAIRPLNGSVMKRDGLLHVQLNRIIASLGHTDWLAVGDCGLPVPPHVERVDLAVVHGLPRFGPVVAAIARELVVQRVYLAEEMVRHNAEVFTFVEQQFSGIPLEKVSHAVFKKQLAQTRGIVRTGEATPYANIILECGVTF